MSEVGRKFDQGKPRYDLYPVGAYEGATSVLTFGSVKYAPWEWKLVPDAKNRYYSALIRHLNSQKLYSDNGGLGLALDSESGLAHLDHAQACLIFLRELRGAETLRDVKTETEWRNALLTDGTKSNTE